MAWLHVYPGHLGTVAKSGYASAPVWFVCSFSPQDKQLVERMAAAPDARDPSLPLGHQCLLLEPPQEHEPVHVYDDRVREALGNGHCVLLAGQNLEGPDSLSLEELMAWRGPQSQNLECMGKQIPIKSPL